MRTVNIGGKDIGLKATPLALVYYKQAFGSDLVGDLVKMQKLEKDPSKLDSVFLLQLTWAMAKAHEGVGKKFPDFMTWVADLESFDFTDDGVLNAIIGEVTDGFFRQGNRNATKR